MSKTATLKGKISLDDTEFQKTIRRATDRAKKFASDTASAIGTAAKAGLIGLGAAGVGAGAGLITAAKAAADLGGQLSDAAAITGISADKMLVLQQAFANAGMSGESAAGVLAKLQAAIGRAGFMSDETEEEVSELRDRMEELQSLKFNGGFDPQAAASMRKEITKLRKMLAEEPNRVLKNQINEQITDLEQSLKQGIDPKNAANIDKEIKKVQDRIKELESDAKGVQQAFKMLGLNQGTLASMDGGEQLLAVFEALGRLENQSDKMAALRMLRLPPELMVLAKDPNAFKAATTQLGQLVGIMANEDMVSQFDRISDVINAKPGILFKQVGAGFLKELTGSKTLQETLNWFEALDLTSVGEKIGAQAAALVDIIRATIENNGGDIWKSLGVGLELLSAKAMELFVSATQIAAGAAMGVMKTIFSDEGGELASSLSGLLVGAFIFAGVQITRIMGALMDDLENQMKSTKIGRLMLGISSLAEMGMNPFSDKAKAFDNLVDAISGESPRSPEEQAAYAKARMSAPAKLWGMTPQEWAQSTAMTAGKTANDAGNFAKALAENITDEISKARNLSGENPATEAVNTALQNAIQAAGPQGSQLYNRLMQGTPSVPIGIERQQVPQVQKPSPSEIRWEFEQARNKQAGDTKTISVLEQIAGLLDRNLTALQVA